MAIITDIQNASSSDSIPGEKLFNTWAGYCLQGIKNDAEISIRIVDEEESQKLNRDWRNRDGATNVLSFPAGENPLFPELLGDIVLCAPLIAREAIEQGKQTDAHWAHLLIHGILHLLGYDHMNDKDAAIMEALETEKLRLLSYPDPYN